MTSPVASTADSWRNLSLSTGWKTGRPPNWRGRWLTIWPSRYTDCEEAILLHLAEHAGRCSERGLRPERTGDRDRPLRTGCVPPGASGLVYRPRDERRRAQLDDCWRLAPLAHGSRAA